MRMTIPTSCCRPHPEPWACFPPLAAKMSAATNICLLPASALCILISGQRGRPMKIRNLVACLMLSWLFGQRAAAQSGGDGGISPWFAEVSASLGIDFQHWDGRSGGRYYVETAASGGGWLDYDGDGDLDIYLLNGAPTPGSPLRPPPRNTLYRNQGGRFVDVTEASGLGDTGYAMGMCTGDYDGDGNLDVMITNYGADRLYRNLGSGRFVEVSQKAGVAGSRWGTGCALGDLDGDGDLDLYVANYVDFHFEHNPKCGNATTKIYSYCRPDAFKGQVDYLYINQGDGTFREEGRARGIQHGENDRGFGVLLSDVDDDGDLDILVANDGSMNRLYVNKGDGYFEDQSLLSGLAFNGDGKAEAGMGVDLGDADGNGMLDMMVTNYAAETNTIYLQKERLFFEDATQGAGMNRYSYQGVSWGVQFFDYDNDGDLDLAVANGHVLDNVALSSPKLSYPQTNHLLENDGEANFRDISASAGPAFAIKKVSRGLAVGDWNNDGRPDLLITNTNDRIDLLENRLERAGHWIGFHLVGPAVNRFAVGAQVKLFAGSLLGVREVRSGGSFLSQSDLRPHFGLGSHQGPVRAEIRWPDGRRQTQSFAETDRYWTISYAPQNEKP